MSPYTLHRLPGIERPDAALVVCGIGSRGAPVSILAKRIEEQGMEVHYMERDGDERLAGGPGAIAEYTQAISGHITALIESGRRVNVIATSFGALLALLAIGKGLGLHSLALLAPLMDAHAALDRAFLKEDGFYKMPVPMSRDSEGERVFVRIREANLDEAPLIAYGHRIEIPTIAIIGDKDEIEWPENVCRLAGPDVAMHAIPGVDHRGIVANKHTRNLLAEFYGRVIPKAA